MNSLIWNNDMRTGNQEIDYHHLKLFEVLSHLNRSIDKNKSKKAIGETLEKFVATLLHHFVAEEFLMITKAFPEYHNYREQHEAMIIKTADLIQAYRDGDSKAKVELAIFLSEWATAHIFKEDQKFFSWLQIKTNFTGA